MLPQPKRRRQRKSRFQQRERISLLGYLTQVNPANGMLLFGGETANCFAYDFGMRPHPGASRRIIDVERNPALVHTGLEMHKIRQRAAHRNFKLPTVPRFPTYYLGFSRKNLPEMEDTPALRQRVAHTMRKTIEEINAMSDEELQPFLRAEWADVFHVPKTETGDSRCDPNNDTDLYLISHQFCSDVQHSLRDYLDFTEMMGADIFNPIRKLLPSTNPAHKTTVANPAERVLKRAGFTPEGFLAWAAKESTDAEELETRLVKLTKAMRKAMPVVEQLFSDEDLVTLLDDHKVDAILPAMETPLKTLGEKETLRLMRYHIGRYAECCRDDDLMEAAEHPNKPLFAAGLVRVQTLYAPRRIPAYFTFDSESLGLDRVQADLITVRPWWRDAHRRPVTERRKS
jgi:hypothetical protein